jgi:hypothetical protein
MPIFILDADPLDDTVFVRCIRSAAPERGGGVNCLHSRAASCRLLSL